jgi:hypothetical protein
MMQQQLLDAMHEEFMLGVEIEIGVQAEIDDRHA